MQIKNEIINRFLEQKKLTREQANFLTKNDSLFYHDIKDLKNSYLFLYELNEISRNTSLEITIAPDYDVDGITSGLMLYYGLKILNISQNVNLYYPKIKDGYGVTKKSIEKISKQYPKTNILITCDNGVAAFEGVKEAKNKGWKVLVTDHHEGKNEDTVADVIVDPNQKDDNFPFKGYSGCVVAWRLLYEYSMKACPEKTEEILELTWLAAISTIADVMVLIDENRNIVKKGLKQMNTFGFLESKAKFNNKITKPLYQGIVEIIKQLNITKEITVSTIGFQIGPVLNSARRMLEDPTIAFEIFLEQDNKDREEKVKKLIEVNNKRKYIVTKEQNRIIKEMNITPDEMPIKCITIANVNHGIVGLIAGNMSKRFKLPHLTFAENKNKEQITLKSSGRSPEYISILKICDILNDKKPYLFEQYGGHAAACGVSIYKDKYEEFEKEFTDTVKEQLIINHLENKRFEINQNAIPIQITNQTLNINNAIAIQSQEDCKDVIQAIKTIENLEPFGHGFEAPIFSIKFNHNQLNYKTMGKEENHSKWETECLPFTIIAWNKAEEIKNSKENIINATGKLNINEFNNKQIIQFIIDELQFVKETK